MTAMTRARWRTGEDWRIEEGRVEGLGFTLGACSDALDSKIHAAGLLAFVPDMIEFDS